MKSPAVAVFAPCDPDDSMPSKDVVRNAQRKARGAAGVDVPAFDAAVGRVVLDDEGLFRVHVRGRHVLWIPDSDQQLQVSWNCKNVSMFKCRSGLLRNVSVGVRGPRRDWSCQISRLANMSCMPACVVRVLRPN